MKRDDIERPQRYLVERDTGARVGSSQFLFLIDLYEKTGNVIFATEAFVYCWEQRYEVPEFLLDIIGQRLKQLGAAKTKDEGLAALGFDSNLKGGAWQLRDAEAKARQAEILRLLEQMEGFGSRNKMKNFKYVAAVCDTTANRVKELYYSSKRKK